MNKERLFTLTLIILAAAASRLVPHPYNFTPITAIALFAGAQFERKWVAFAVPAAALLLSDAIIGFYSQMWLTYMAFAIVVCIGFLLRGHVRAWPVVGASFASSALFYLITNCAFWLPYDIYPHTLQGLVQGYVAGLPFFQNALAGDMFYSGLLFGGFALTERRFAGLKLRQPATA